MTIALVMALSIAAAPSQAAASVQAPVAATTEAAVDARWAPWLGCWRAEGPKTQAGVRICVVPGNGGARRLTITDGAVVEDQLIVPDGVARPMQSADCQGKETAQWLKRESRLVRSAEVTCGADGAHSVTGVAFLIRGPVWIEAQTVDKAGKRGVRIQRYRRAADQQLPVGLTWPAAALQLASGQSGSTDRPWTVDDVIEASGKVPAEVLQAALSESGTGFPLSGKALGRLADAKVAESIIDLMVALSNPKRFQVRRADGGASGWASTYQGWPGLEESLFITMRSAGMAFPGFYDPLGYWYDCDFFASCGGFYPYSYDYGYWGGGGWVEVDPGPPVGGGGSGAPIHGHGKVVNGLGYTQVSVRPDPAIARTSSGSGGSSTSSGSSSGSSGSSGSGSASPSGGYSSGGGGGGDRTAVPRGPGE